MQDTKIYRKDFYDPYLEGIKDHTTNPKDYFDIIPRNKFARQINQRAVLDEFSTKSLSVVLIVVPKY
jgi:hypothetical protein